MFEQLLENLNLYLPNFLATLASASALSMLGFLLLSRGEMLQSIVVSQASALGATLVLALSLSMGVSIGEFTLLPILGSVVMAIFVLLLLKSLSLNSKSLLSLILMAAFIFSLSLNYLITAAVPSLEAHFVSAFLGDIATASAPSAWYLCVLSILFILTFAYRWKRLMLQAFWLSLSDTKISRGTEILYVLFSAFLIVEATRIFGFLFTASSILVFPLALSLSLKKAQFLKRKLFLLSVFTHLCAFILALQLSNLPTSALLCVAQFFVGGLLVFASQRFSKQKNLGMGY